MSKKNKMLQQPEPFKTLNILDHRTFERGRQEGLAWAEIVESELNLVRVIEHTALMILATTGSPADWQEKRIRALLDIAGKRQPIKEQLRAAAHNLRDTIRGVDHFFNLKPDNPINYDQAEYFMKFALDLSDGIAAILREDSDHGALLLDTLQKYGGEDILKGMEVMRANAPKLGAKSEPHPITKFVLDETRDLKHLHGLRTRGEQMERVITNIEKRPDVQMWTKIKLGLIGDKFEEELKKQSVQVQVYDKYKPFHEDRSKLGDMLKQMQDNNPHYMGG